jgi:hypothetical protein
MIIRTELNIDDKRHASIDLLNTISGIAKGVIGKVVVDNKDIIYCPENDISRETFNGVVDSVIATKFKENILKDVNHG